MEASEVKFLRRKHYIFLILSVSIIVFDQITKWALLERFRLGESIPVISGLLNLTYIRNTGAAFGFLAAADPSFRVPFFVLVPIFALLVIVYVFRRIPDNDIRSSSALALVMGGAVGNLIDRVRFGYVVDFLDFHWNFSAHFPAFNVADSAICVGVGLLMLDLFINKDTESDSEREKGDPHAPASV